MPQQNMSSKIGSSPSPSIERVVQNSKDGQKPLPVNTATQQAFNKQPMKP